MAKRMLESCSLYDILLRWCSKKGEPIERRDIKIPRAQLLSHPHLKEPKNKPDAKRGDLQRHGCGGWDCCQATMLRRFKWTKWIAWSWDDTVNYSGRELAALSAVPFISVTQLNYQLDWEINQSVEKTFIRCLKIKMPWQHSGLAG